MTVSVPLVVHSTVQPAQSGSGSVPLDKWAGSVHAWVAQLGLNVTLVWLPRIVSTLQLGRLEKHGVMVG